MNQQPGITAVIASLSTARARRQGRADDQEAHLIAQRCTFGARRLVARAPLAQGGDVGGRVSELLRRIQRVSASASSSGIEAATASTSSSCSNSTSSATTINSTSTSTSTAALSSPAPLPGAGRRFPTHRSASPACLNRGRLLNDELQRLLKESTV